MQIAEAVALLCIFLCLLLLVYHIADIRNMIRDMRDDKEFMAGLAEHNVRLMMELRKANGKE